MTDPLYSLPDAEFADVFVQPQATICGDRDCADGVFDRVQRFNQIYCALEEKPVASALLYLLLGSSPSSR